jgi:hypothetical protein
MQSRTARVTCCAVAWLAIGCTSTFLIYSEREIAERRAATRTFDLRAREAIDALADLRAAQQAYVAAGQGVTYWMPRVAAITDAITQTLADLQASAMTAAGKTALDEAVESVGTFSGVDKRARDYVKSGQSLMAGDVIFTEGGETAAAAGRRVESARVSEGQAVDASEAARRKLEAATLTAAVAFAALALAVLVPVARPRQDSAAVAPAAAIAPGAVDDEPAETATPRPPLPEPEDWMLRESPRRIAPSSTTVAGPLGLPAPLSVPARTESPLLKGAAQLCTELARVTSSDDVRVLLGQAADLMDASGLVVWLGGVSGADLRPVLAHGYSSQALARMPTVPRSANNAAAAAYRSGTMQIVLARPGSSPGALVAPLLSPDGCIGALSAEIAGGGETSDGIQALATIFAAQLTAVLGPPSETPENKAAVS